MKDWNGNKPAVYVTIGASNHSVGERQEHDYYATEPKAVEILLDHETFFGKIWECACGEGHIGKVLEKRGYEVIGTDLVNRGGYGLNKSVDFLKTEERNLDIDIITNPPYKYAQEFVEKAIDVIAEEHKVAMFLKLTFLEGKSRRKMFDENPPKKVYVFSSRVNCAKNGEFNKYPSSAVAYAWFIWEKGFKGKPTIEWVN